MSPLERLLLEAVPDGRFGGPRQARDHMQPPPDPLASEHCRVLLAALAERPVSARGDPAMAGGVGAVGP